MTKIDKEINLLSQITKKTQKKRQKPQQTDQNLLQNEVSLLKEDLQTLLNIANLIGNNPGVMTIILKELKNKLNLEKSKEIVSQFEKINQKISEKAENHIIESKKRSISFNSAVKFEQTIKNNKKNEIPPCFEEIEQKISDFKEKHKEKAQIQKLNEEGGYKIGNRKVILQLINGKLVVRIGGGFLQLKDFLEFDKENSFVK